VSASKIGWVASFAALTACGSGSSAPPPATSGTREPQASAAQADDPEPSGPADEGCRPGAPDVQSGRVLGVAWRFEVTDAEERLVIGDDHVIPLDRNPTTGCFSSYALYGWWGRPSRMAWTLIHFDPDYSPLAHAGNPDEDACRRLDGPLADRSAAAQSIRETHAIIVEGGSEQQMEAAGEYCRRTYGFAPSWLPRPRPPAALAAEVEIVVGGNYAVDHLGQARFDEVREHVLADASSAIDALDTMIANATPDTLAGLWPSNLYEMTHRVLRARSEQSAAVTLATYASQITYERGLGTPEGTALATSLEQRRAVIEELTHTW
jgi:hypothetical protein